MLSIRTILHPTDFSDHSALAFGVVCALARDYGACLVVLHVDLLPLLFFGEIVAPVGTGTPAVARTAPGAPASQPRDCGGAPIEVRRSSRRHS